MASIATSILNATVGLLLNKVRDKTADKLKDGDITDAQIREIIVRELDDVKGKLEGLSRSYLLTSYSFLQEGVNLLKSSLDQSEEKLKALLSETHGDDGETSSKPSDVESGILTGALTLSQAMGRVKMNSDKEFESAKERFKDARKEATRAFFNEGLSIKDRIFAAKLRIVSELLEFLESPKTAITNCLPFLRKLHSLPPIREVFSVYINQGYKSKFNKAERAENVKAVMSINYVLFKLVLKFNGKYCSPRTWPTIDLADRTFNPILSWKEVSTRISSGDEFVQPPNEVILRKQTYHVFYAVTSHGEIIARALRGNISVTSRTGEVKVAKLNYPAGDGEVIGRYIQGLAVDSNDNVYVLMYLKTRTESGVVMSDVLYVFDDNYNAKQNCTLHFLNVTIESYADIAVNKHNNVIIDMFSDPHLYVCDITGQLKLKFKRDTSSLRTLTISDKNEILLASSNLTAFHRYTEKGDLGLTVKVPEGHEICGVAFHHVICKIMVLTIMEESNAYFLLCYSETSELENSTLLWKRNEICDFPVIRSHPSGPVAVVWRESITFI